MTGGQKLHGTVRVEGAKNAVLPILAAALLASKGENVIKEVPNLADVYTINEVLKSLNADVTYIPEANEVYIDAAKELSSEAQFEYVSKMRASILVMGSLLARNGYARVALPGGCAIGSRPIELHLKGFEAMGAKISFGHGYVEAKVEDRLQGANVYLDFPSVGATENIMTAAALAKGTTIIENAAKEPEIIDVATLLTSMGARIKGAGTDVIRIDGVDSLHGCHHTIIPDRIEAGTYMILGAASGGEVTVDNVIPQHLESVTAKLREAGVQVETNDDQITVNGNRKLKVVDIKTLVYPGFPTDLQQPFTTLLTKAHGTGVVTDTIYGARFKHIDELRRMNAQIKVEGRSAIVTGPVLLQGAKVKASDLRAGAALVIAGLMADGITEVTGLEHIDRGYENIVDKLKGLGANIWREQMTKQEIEEMKNA